MAEFNVRDLEKIRDKEEVLQLLIDEGIIKEKKFIKQLNYEKELGKLQYELVRLQAHIVEQGKRLLVIFEGRDAAGKGGAIQRTRMNLNPKKYRVVALSKPNEEEKGQWYFQRYLKHLPTAGEMVFFDRSWYNRSMVEPVFGFCTKEQYKVFMQQVGEVEDLLVKEDIVFLKIFLDISKQEQQERLQARADDPLKRWKLGALDKQALEKWDNYTHYINKMLEKTSSPKTPWAIVKTDDKKTARLQVIKYILTHFPGFKPEKELYLDKEIIEIKK